MNRPPTLDIFGVTIPVRWLRRRPAWVNPKAVYGGCDFDGKVPRIWIWTGADDAEQRSSLLHELGHLALYMKRVNLSDDDEETAVSAIEDVVDDVLTNNPALVDLFRNEG